MSKGFATDNLISKKSKKKVILNETLTTCIKKEGKAAPYRADS